MYKFDIPEDKIEKLEKWTNHKCKYKKEVAIGGRFTYEFTPTGAGMIIIVKCICGKSINLTGDF